MLQAYGMFVTHLFYDACCPPVTQYLLVSDIFFQVRKLEAHIISYLLSRSLSYHHKHFNTLQYAFLSNSRSTFNTFLQRIISITRSIFITFKYANTSNTRSISVLPNRLMNEIIEAFSELGNNIGRNWTIIQFLIGNNMGYNRHFFYREVTCGFLHAELQKLMNHHVTSVVA